MTTPAQGPPAPSRRERQDESPAGLPSALRGLLLPLLRWVGRRVPGFHGPLAVVLGLALALILGSLAAFTELAEWVGEGKTRAWDEQLLLRVHQHSSPFLDLAAGEVTALGATVVMGMVLFVASVLLWVSNHRYSVLLLWVALVGSTVLNGLLKAVYDRPRPALVPWGVDHAAASSFPSGHSMVSMSAYATLAYLVARLGTTRFVRWLTFVVFGATVVLIGASRVYLGVHYPSDVVAGFLSGLAWAAFSALGIEAVRYYRRRNPAVEEVEEDLDGAGEEAGEAESA